VILGLISISQASDPVRIRRGGHHSAWPFSATSMATLALLGASLMGQAASAPSETFGTCPYKEQTIWVPNELTSWDIRLGGSLLDQLAISADDNRCIVDFRNLPVHKGDTISFNHCQVDETTLSCDGTPTSVTCKNRQLEFMPLRLNGKRDGYVMCEAHTSSSAHPADADQAATGAPTRPLLKCQVVSRGRIECEGRSISFSSGDLIRVRRDADSQPSPIEEETTTGKPILPVGTPCEVVTRGLMKCGGVSINLPLDWIQLPSQERP